MSWLVVECDNGAHVVPEDDGIVHAEALDCICGPDVEWFDPDTDESYPSGPLVTHHSLDGRERYE